MALNYLSLIEACENEPLEEEEEVAAAAPRSQRIEETTTQDSEEVEAFQPAKKAKLDMRPTVEIYQLKKQRKSEKIQWVNKDGIQQLVFKNKSIVPTVLDIAPGEAVLFRQDLPHAGCGYENTNLRIHAAFDLLGNLEFKFLVNFNFYLEFIL
jgi:hypothetical protein